MTDTTLPSGSLFAHRPFLFFMASRALSSMAFQGTGVAIGWLVYDQTRNPFDLGLIGLCQFLPMVVLTFVVGHVADQFDRRRIGFACQVVEALTLLVVALGVWQGWLGTAGIFVAVTLPHFDAAHFDPFMPFGFPKHSVIGPDGHPAEVGVMAAAAIIFFAFYGFDAIATAAEETKNPGRDLAIGIVGSMIVCVIIYMAVAAAAIGALAFSRFANSPEPLALILREIGQPLAAKYLAVSAVVALPTVILAFFYGQSRIFFVMARDGLLPKGLARVSGRGSPVRITLFTAIVVAVLAGVIPLDELAALANAGTLTAFIAVTVCMLILRRRAPDAPRRFRTPAAWPVGIVAILGCCYLLYSLPQRTQIWFVCAHIVGLVIYFAYGARRSVAGQEARA